MDIYGNFTDIPNWSEWTNKCIEWREKYDPVKPEYFGNDLSRENHTVNTYAICRLLSEQMTKDDILCVDCGGNLVAINHAFKTKEGQIYITNNGNSPMGGAVGYAIGAAFAKKKYNLPGQVVCVIGDGGMMVNLQELQTIISYDLNIKIVLINNKIYGITKEFERSNFDARYIACGGEKKEDYHPCDFTKVCKAFGIPVIDQYTNSAGDIIFKLKEIFNYPESIVLNAHCDNYHKFVPAIRGWACPLEEQVPHLPRKEFFEQMIIEPTQFSKDLKDE